MHLHSQENKRRENNSIVSIRDIQEVRDKVPASPATHLVDQNDNHF